MDVGQWLGKYNGNDPGDIILNLELINGNYFGQIILKPLDIKLPFFVANIRIEGANLNIATISEFTPINPSTKLPAFSDEEKNNISLQYPNIKIPVNGNLTITHKTGTELKGFIKTCILKNTNFTLNLQKAGMQVHYQPIVKTWDEYKSYICTLNPNNYIFRGQPEPLPLRTTFHRHNRYNLARYIMNDIHTLLRHICAESGKLYNLQDRLEYGALLYLAQHYGYPTPLLDWTRSPYIAAYFAFSDIFESCPQSYVRIFIFDSYNWNIDHPPITDIGTTNLSLSVLELMAIHNNRAIPQQSVTLFSNVDDIQAFIKVAEEAKKKNYLTIVDLPLSERKIVLQELFQMGVTASSLFPGLQGVCKMLKEKYFWPYI